MLGRGKTRFPFIFKKCGYNLLVLLLAIFSKSTPKYQKGLILFVILYIVSPIDLIPDSIPIAGLLDDAVLGSAVLTVVIGLLPKDVKSTCCDKADLIIEKAPLILIVMAIIPIVVLVLIIISIGKIFS